jgi:hypothetical protein
MRLHPLLTHLLIPLACLAESSVPPSVGSPDYLAIIARYDALAMSTFDSFEKEVQAETPTGKTFFVVTRLFEGTHFEQVFVQVDTVSTLGYEGRIASQSQGQVRFQSGQPITLKKEQIVDWMIVHENGAEEGNTLGKVANLIRSGFAIAVVKMTYLPESGLQSEVVSLSNAMTQQDVTMLLPEEVRFRIRDHVTRTHTNLPHEAAERFLMIMVSFPEWQITS